MPDRVTVPPLQQTRGFAWLSIKCIIAFYATITLSACHNANSSKAKKMPLKILAQSELRVHNETFSAFIYQEKEKVSPRQGKLHIQAGEQTQTFTLSLDDLPKKLWFLPSSRGEKPSLFLWLQSVGSGSYGRLLRFDAKTQGYAPLQVPILPKSEQKGYEGHDRYQVLHHSIRRCFPLYRPQDTNSQPTGGMRCLRYDLAKNRWRSLSQP